MLKSGRGFTLIEILIAICILSIVLTTVYGAYTGTFRIVKETEYEDNIYSMARNVMKVMTDDLASISQYDGAFKMISRRSTVTDLDFMDLTFLTSSHLDLENQGYAGMSIVTYFIEQEDERGTFILKRKDVLYRDENQEDEEVATFVMCRGLKAMSYIFYDEKGNELEVWDSDSEQQKGKVPSTVSIVMEFMNAGDGGEPYKFMTKVAIPVAE